MSDADDDLHDTYTEHVIFLLKINNPSVCHPVWPPSGPYRALRLAPSSSLCLAPCLTPVGHPVRPPIVLRPRESSKKKKKTFFFFFLWLLLVAGKEGKKYFGFRFSIPEFPEFPEFPKFPKFPKLRRRSREKKKVFSA
jgi:hypothetical protein